MKFLIKFAQAHEAFRLAEIKSLATLESIQLVVDSYDVEVSTKSGPQSRLKPGPLLMTATVAILYHIAGVGGSSSTFGTEVDTGPVYP